MEITNRTDLAKLFNLRGYKVGAEIGVDTGLYSEVLCKEIPGLKLFAVDVWDFNAEKSFNIRNRVFEEAKARLAPYNVALIKKPSLEAVNYFVDGSLDFVYIDAAHSFDDVMQDIIKWKTKVRKGGVVAGHDYNPDIPYLPRDSVATAVDAYSKGHAYHLNLTKDTSEILTWWFDKKWNG